MALILNMREGRLRQSGVLIVSMHTGRAAMLGDNPLSALLRKDFENPKEYSIASQFGKKLFSGFQTKSVLSTRRLKVTTLTGVTPFGNKS
jgi:hypothetical protein